VCTVTAIRHHDSWEAMAKLFSKLRVRLARVSVAIVGSSMLVSGCASTSYMGISLGLGETQPTVQALAAKARGGDKPSQYELGRWFEDSSEPEGLRKAIKLYRIAATPRGGTRLFYTSGSSGVITSVVSSGPLVEGNKAAETRLRELELVAKVENTGNFVAAGGVKITSNQSPRLRWFKLKNERPCKNINPYQASCVYFFTERRDNDLVLASVAYNMQVVVDISGLIFCRNICISRDNEILISDEIRSEKPIFLYLSEGKKIVGVVIQNSNQDGVVNNLFLSDFGSELSSSKFNEILMRYKLRELRQSGYR
jgi:hypothetical protein